MKGKWSKDIEKYQLLDGYSIERANWKDFSVYFAVYEVFNTNIWFRQSFDIYCSILKDCDLCFWIKKDGHRIGGVLLEPNYMNCLFLEPPHNKYDIIIAKLKNILLSWSDNSPIYIGGVKPDTVKYYQRQGFRTGVSRRCMIRPTEEFEIIWNDEHKLLPVTKENINEISQLFVEAFTTTDSKNLEQHHKSLQYYFDNNPQDSLVNKASTLIYDIKTNQLIGACLISIWEEWPNIYDVAVKPSFQNKGLAKNMIKRALSILKEQYPVLRLFVTLGNDAEMVYHKMGFLAGIETTEMFLLNKGD